MIEIKNKDRDWDVKLVKRTEVKVVKESQQNRKYIATTFTSAFARYVNNKDSWNNRFFDI